MDIDLHAYLVRNHHLEDQLYTLTRMARSVIKYVSKVLDY